MKKQVTMILVCLMVITSSMVYGQQDRKKFGVGLNTGATRILGDRAGKGGRQSFGFGTEGVFTYRVLPFADVGVTFGYQQLRYAFTKNLPGSITDMLNWDIKSNIDVMPNSNFSPYFTVGFGALNYQIRNSGLKRVWDAEILGGLGVRYQLSSVFGLYLGADYRYGFGDTFDNVIQEGQWRDAYMNFRSGFNYNFGSSRSQSPQVVAEARAPLYEIDGESNRRNQDFTTNATDPSASSQDMAEYVKLKSRIDELSSKVDSREQEIAGLRNNLSGRRQRLSSLEQQVEGRPATRRPRRSSMSGFSQIYEEALTNYYNKNYSEAISLFRLLLSQYKEHSLASNCQFWVGQCYFSMNQYPKAIDEFGKVLAYRRSFKKDDALFFVGKSYLQVGSGEQARQAFNQLISEYPYSEFADEARGYIARL